MEILEYVTLKEYNTFGIDVKARYFIEATNLEDVKEILELKGYPDLFLLGGGSNMLLLADLDYLVVHLNLKGITEEIIDSEKVQVTAMAGEVWHDFTQWVLVKDYGGIENLSLIPGNIGTAPIQNIGAYGVELQDVFVRCQVMDRQTGELSTLTKSDCRFGYRDSIFKRESKNKYIILSVTLELSRRDHKKRIGYGAIGAALEGKSISDPSIQDIAEAVISIRQSKLPDPAILGNSGSFFKNPVVSPSTFDVFRQKHPEAPFYSLENGDYKIPAGWLIEASGLKGFRMGEAGVHQNQALVLVNHGKASGKDIWTLAEHVQKTVEDKFGIALEPEVNIIG